VENGKSYNVGPNRGYVDSSSLDLLPKMFGILVFIISSSSIVRHRSISYLPDNAKKKAAHNIHILVTGKHIIPVISGSLVKNFISNLRSMHSSIQHLPQPIVILKQTSVHEKLINIFLFYLTNCYDTEAGSLNCPLIQQVPSVNHHVYVPASASITFINAVIRPRLLFQKVGQPRSINSYSCSLRVGKQAVASPVML